MEPSPRNRIKWPYFPHWGRSSPGRALEWHSQRQWLTDAVCDVSSSSKVVIKTRNAPPRENEEGRFCAEKTPANASRKGSFLWTVGWAVYPSSQVPFRVRREPFRPQQSSKYYVDSIINIYQLSYCVKYLFYSPFQNPSLKFAGLQCVHGGHIHIFFVGVELYPD